MEEPPRYRSYDRLVPASGGSSFSLISPTYGLPVSPIAHSAKSTNSTNFRDYPTATRFRSAGSKGRLPPAGADSVLWQRDLTKVIRQERYFVWLGPLIFGACAVLGLFLAAQNPGHPRFWVICAAIFTGLAIWAPISVVHRQRKMESLISELLGRHVGDQSP